MSSSTPEDEADRAAHRSARNRAFRDGLLISLPLIPSYAPFGLVCGVSAVQAGLGEWGAIALSALTYAGSAQAVLTQFMGTGAPLLIAILSGLVVNLRIAVYSAAIAPRLQGATRGQRFLWAFFLVDQSFIFNEARHARGQHRGHELAYFLGCAALVWPWWILMTGLGAFLGGQLPASWQLEFTIPLSFIALVVPLLKQRQQIAAASAGAIAGIVLYTLPLKLGLIAACLIGTCAGLLVDTWLQRQRNPR